MRNRFPRSQKNRKFCRPYCVQKTGTQAITQTVQPILSQRGTLMAAIVVGPSLNVPFPEHVSATLARSLAGPEILSYCKSPGYNNYRSRLPRDAQEEAAQTSGGSCS